MCLYYKLCRFGHCFSLFNFSSLCHLTQVMNALICIVTNCGFTTYATATEKFYRRVSYGCCNP